MHKVLLTLLLLCHCCRHSVAAWKKYCIVIFNNLNNIFKCAAFSVEHNDHRTLMLFLLFFLFVNLFLIFKTVGKSPRLVNYLSVRAGFVHTHTPVNWRKFSPVFRCLWPSNSIVFLLISIFLKCKTHTCWLEKNALHVFEFCQFLVTCCYCQYPLIALHSILLTIYWSFQQS